VHFITIDARSVANAERSKTTEHGLIVSSPSDTDEAETRRETRLEFFLPVVS
jgi:hypothetical protein